jgi:hypothetical protein
MTELVASAASSPERNAKHNGIILRQNCPSPRDLSGRSTARHLRGDHELPHLLWRHLWC